MSSHRHVGSCTGRRPSARTSRTAAAVLAAGASLALVAGCASATGGTGTAGAGAAVPAAATSSAAAPSVTGLATRVVTAVSKATSVHVSSDLSGLSVLPVTIGTVEGDVALANGKPSAADVTAGAYGLRYVDGTAWVALPGDTATPWWLVSTDSSNPMIAAAAAKLEDAKAKLTGFDPTALLGAASGLTEVGPSDVDGTAATEYAFSVDATKVAAALGVDGTHGVTGPVPVHVWLDGSDRPLRVTATPTTSGGAAKTFTVTLSAWNAPVSITAPDPSKVHA